MRPEGLQQLSHYYRPFSRPLMSLSALPDAQVPSVLAHLSGHEPLPFRLSRSEYLPERRRIEALMKARFTQKGGHPVLDHPHYFILGVFSHWESDGSLRVQLPVDSVPGPWISFTLTDSFFNYCRTSLHGAAIPHRAYHDELFTAAELPAQLASHDLPTDAWRTDPERRFEVYVEAQVWSDEPVTGLRSPG